MIKTTTTTTSGIHTNYKILMKKQIEIRKKVFMYVCISMYSILYVHTLYNSSNYSASSDK